MVKHGQPGVVPLAGFATVEDVLAGLRERGVRVTSARRLLLAALFGDRAHRSAEELAGQVQAQAPDVNLSTIYRNLDELVRLGVVDRSHLGGGPAAYHLASATHGHLVCEQCGAMTEVPGELFRDVAEKLATRYGFTVNPHRFGVIGRCANCQRHDTGQLPILWMPKKTAAGAAAGRLATGGYTVVYDGVIGPWFLETFAAATRLSFLHYVVLLPPEPGCLERVRSRADHGFKDQQATRHMYQQFAGADVDPRYVAASSDDATTLARRLFDLVHDGRLRVAYPPESR